MQKCACKKGSFISLEQARFKLISIARFLLDFRAKWLTTRNFSPNQIKTDHTITTWSILASSELELLWRAPSIWARLGSIASAAPPDELEVVLVPPLPAPPPFEIWLETRWTLEVECCEGRWGVNGTIEEKKILVNQLICIFEGTSHILFQDMFLLTYTLRSHHHWHYINMGADFKI